MTYRHVYEGGVWKNYTLVYDAENRLATVTGPVTANFKYDGDNTRVRATINGGLDTVFIGNYFEWNVATQTKRTYYYAGATRIAMREGSADPQWILGDHLGSTSKMVSYAGADSGGQWYKAWGETRLQTGTIPTKYQYTGQYNQVIIGLYYYGARWYDTNLSRWIQPDILIPNPSNSIDYDRYSYVRNNPVRYIDPSGHCTGDPNDSGSLTKAEKECWRLYNNFNQWFPNVNLGSHTGWDASSLTNFRNSLELARKAFGGQTGFLNALGYFKVNGPLSFAAWWAEYFYDAGGMARPDSQTITLTRWIFSESDLIAQRILHELGHIFDFHAKENSSAYLSQMFINVWGSNCPSSGWLGCESNSSNRYPFLSTKGYSPILDETTKYGSESSIDDFADSFAASVLEINKISIPYGFGVSDSRIAILKVYIGLFFNPVCPMCE